MSAPFLAHAVGARAHVCVCVNARVFEASCCSRCLASVCASVFTVDTPRSICFSRRAYGHRCLVCLPHAQFCLIVRRFLFYKCRLLLCKRKSSADVGLLLLRRVSTFFTVFVVNKTEPRTLKLPSVASALREFTRL